MKQDKPDLSYTFTGEGLTSPESRVAKKRFWNYVAHYPHLNRLSDLHLLEELVYLECIQERYKKNIKNSSKGQGVDKDAVPKTLKDGLGENLEKIMKLKEKLGMFEDKKKLDSFKFIYSVVEKFKLWCEQNQGSREVACPFCAKPFLLRFRTKDYDATAHPFFQDKILCNPILHKLWKEGRITKKEYGDILGTSADYPEWLEEHHFNKKNPLKDQE